MHSHHHGKRYSGAMATIQIRNVPDEVHRRFQARAALAGQSLQEYMLGRLIAEASAPTVAELLGRGGTRPADRSRRIRRCQRRRCRSGGPGRALIVVDASVVVDALVVRGPDGDAARRAMEGADGLAAPSILTAEVTSALRSLERRQDISATRAAAALDVMRRLPYRAFPIDPVLDRVWALRSTLTVYDAWYVALAERLGVTPPHLRPSPRRRSRTHLRDCHGVTVVGAVPGGHVSPIAVHPPTRRRTLTGWSLSAVLRVNTAVKIERVGHVVCERCPGERCRQRTATTI